MTTACKKTCDDSDFECESDVGNASGKTGSYHDSGKRDTENDGGERDTCNDTDKSRKGHRSTAVPRRPLGGDAPFQ